MNSAGPQWDSNKFNGRARRRARKARRPSLDEQVVGMVGEERPDRPVYTTGDPRTPFTPLSPRGRQVSVGPEEDRAYTSARACVCACVHESVRRCSIARTEDGGSKG